MEVIAAREDKRYALIFMGMYSTKFGQFERYNIAFAKKLLAKNIKPVYIYNKTPEVKEYLDTLNELQVELHVLNPDIGFFSKVKRIKKLIKQYNPEVIHTHFRGSIIRPVIYTSYFMRVKKRFNTFHCRIPQHKLITKIWMKSLHLMCTRLFAVSDAIRDEQIEAMYAPEQKLETLRLGVNKALFDNIALPKTEVRKKYGLPINGIIIANVAFHHPEKGIDVLLEAVKQINDKLEDKITLYQVGQQLAREGGQIDTDYTDLLKQKQKDLRLDNHIVWLGRQNNVPELLSAADIYVHASRDEGLGLILLEAFLSKLPVVGSNVGGIPEVVDNDRGFLFENEQSKELAEKLLQLIASKELRKEKGLKGYKFVDEHYNIDKQIEKMITYYV